MKLVRFENGQDLLSYPDRIDILFLDIQMGDSNGIEAARELGKAGNNVTIIFVTAIEEYVFQAFDVKAFHYLVKPIEQIKFFEVLREAMADRKRNKAMGILCRDFVESGRGKGLIGIVYFLITVLLDAVPFQIDGFLAYVIALTAAFGVMVWLDRRNIRMKILLIGISQAAMTAMVSADSSIKQAQVQGNVARQNEGRADILKAEMKQDAALGGNTRKKEEELAEIEQKATDVTAAQINTLSAANKKIEEAASADRESGKTESPKTRDVKKIDGKQKNVEENNERNS